MPAPAGGAFARAVATDAVEAAAERAEHGGRAVGARVAVCTLAASGVANAPARAIGGAVAHSRWALACHPTKVRGALAVPVDTDAAAGADERGAVCFGARQRERAVAARPPLHAFAAALPAHATAAALIEAAGREGLRRRAVLAKAAGEAGRTETDRRRNCRAIASCALNADAVP